ncbi:hypothetical protein [uncultured Fibrobacter sp.]|uniref:hypothetical protein n=1 Tax=uncultured Fibrobacter sp. TaxID=261512 RepID=UPI0025E8D6E8|nr:hypothetical protein [uncultured Fibrobacter sp.]
MILKNWKLILAALSLAMFTACAGSSGGSEESGDDGYSYEDDGSGNTVKKKKPVKVDKDELKDSEKEAMALTEENHKLRKEIFDAKNKLGLPTGQGSDDASAGE